MTLQKELLKAGFVCSRGEFNKTFVFKSLIFYQHLNTNVNY